MSRGDTKGESGYDAARRTQARAGLRMTPAERLRWLEETMETMRRWQGRARQQPPDVPQDSEGGD